MITYYCPRAEPSDNLVNHIPSSQEKQFFFLQSLQLLQNSRKKYISCKIGELESKSCKILATILLHFLISCKHFARVLFLESCKKCIFCKNRGRNLAKSNLSVYSLLRSDNLYISPKSKHNQPLEVKFDELYTCWAYFVIEYV